MMLKIVYTDYNNGKRDPSLRVNYLCSNWNIFNGTFLWNGTDVGGGS